MLLSIEWDEGNWPKCGKHGLSKEQIESFFANDPSIRPDPYRGEPRFRAIGPDATGRYLFMVFTLRETDGLNYVRPLSARHMHQKEVDRYEQDSSQTASVLRH